MRFFKRINRYLTFVLVLWTISVSFILASLINHPRLKFVVKEDLPDYLFTVDTEINGNLYPYLVSVSYDEFWGFGGVTYKLETIDENTIKLVFPYSGHEHKEIQHSVEATIFLRRQSDNKYKSFFILRQSFGDIVPNPINYYTNVSVSSFNHFMPNKEYVVRRKYNKLNVKKVVIDTQKGFRSLSFFGEIKLVFD
ncbi:MAG TPA: hypothetical protein VHO03_03200 [Ignavibacteriales bacterium]|nr:hypothetical protein [Ignavibacteriales bacterium]